MKLSTRGLTLLIGLGVAFSLYFARDRAFLMLVIACVVLGLRAAVAVATRFTQRQQASMTESVPGDSPPSPQKNERIIERYRDFQKAGEWGVVTVCKGGEEPSSVVEGSLLSETVKVATMDGGVRLKAVLLPDTDRHVTGFDRTLPFRESAE